MRTKFILIKSWLKWLFTKTTFSFLHFTNLKFLEKAITRTKFGWSVFVERSCERFFAKKANGNIIGLFVVVFVFLLVATNDQICWTVI